MGYRRSSLSFVPNHVRLNKPSKKEGNFWLFAILGMGLLTVLLFCVGFLMIGPMQNREMQASPSGASKNPYASAANPYSGGAMPYPGASNPAIGSMGGGDYSPGAYGSGSGSGMSTGTKIFSGVFMLGVIGGMVAWGIESPISFLIGGPIPIMFLGYCFFNCCQYAMTG